MGKSSAKFGTEVRLIGEMLTTGNKVGAGRSFYSALAHDEELFQRTVEFVKTANEISVSFQNISFGENWKKKGWSSEKGPAIQKGDFPLELVSFCEDGKSISGKELERMAIEQGCCELGLAHAEQLLKQQDRIPKSWRKHYLVFAGSVWRDAGGARDVPFLDWDGDRWYLCFSWLRSDFGSYGRFVRPCK